MRTSQTALACTTRAGSDWVKEGKAAAAAPTASVDCHHHQDHARGWQGGFCMVLARERCLRILLRWQPCQNAAQGDAAAAQEARGPQLPYLEQHQPCQQLRQDAPEGPDVHFLIIGQPQDDLRRPVAAGLDVRAQVVCDKARGPQVNDFDLTPAAGRPERRQLLCAESNRTSQVLVTRKAQLWGQRVPRSWAGLTHYDRQHWVSAKHAAVAPQRPPARSGGHDQI